MTYIHDSEIIHRDLKPANILLRANGDPVIGDFGIAIADDQTRFTQVGGGLGTVPYTAPEVLIGGSATVQSDIFALGLMLYEMLSGHHPFIPASVYHPTVSTMIHHSMNTKVPNIRTYVPDIPKPIAAVLNRCLAKNPADRPQSVNEFLVALDFHDSPSWRTMAVAVGVTAVLGSGFWLLVPDSSPSTGSVQVAPLQPIGVQHTVPLLIPDEEESAETPIPVTV